MTDRLPPARRQYAHRASRRRQPVYAITAGVLVVALCIPIWRAVSDRSGHRATSHRVTTTQPSSTTAPAAPRPSGPTSTPIPQTGPGVQIKVVPAVRDVQVMVDGTLYTTTSDGLVEAPGARGTVQVAFVGYSVIPALQEVAFDAWSDGLTTPSRTLDAGGHGHISLAIDVRYRVTVTLTPSAPGAISLTASSPVGPVQFTNGSRRWVLAQRGERSGAEIVARTITYSFDPPHGAPAGQRQEFTAGPEALWTVRAP